MTTDKSILKGWFSTGLKPEQEQFWAWIDSYYHKKDLVPMAAVDGLENALTKKAEASSLQYFAVKDGSNITGTENWKNKLGISLLDAVKANKDASGLSVQHIEAWKNTLGVGEIPENMATNDSEDDDGNPVSGTSYTKEQSDGKYYPKVGSPYFNSNYVLMADGSPKAAGDLGKNVANSSLTSVTGAGLTLGAAWAMNTAGQNYAVTGLNDVSANSAFSSLLTQNAAGQVGKSNGKQPFLNMPALLSDAEKTAWKTSMNGGWTTNTMSVGVISPPVVDQKDRPYWINLKGTNLNLPPTNFKIELCTSNSVSAGTATVIAEIPASQVQLYTSGIDLILYYNFKNIPTGQYKIRLWNGVAWYLTGLTISVVAQIQRVDLDNIIWEKKIYNNAASSVITQSGSSVNYSSDSNVKALGDDSSYIAARKTNQLIAADEDFYMTVELSGKTATFTNANGSMTHFVGLVNPANPIDLLNQTLINVRLVQSYWYPMAKIYADSSNVSSNVSDTTYSFSATFIRRGGSWTIIVYHNNQTFIYTKTGYTGAIAFGMYNMNTSGTTGVSANIVELYKL